MKLPKEEFDYFRNRVYHWQNHFGMHEWNIDVQWEDKVAKCDDCHAFTDANVSEMFAWIIVAKDWDDITKPFLDRTACHEVVEVMLSEVEEIGDARYIRKGELRAAVHKVINRIVKTLCK